MKKACSGRWSYTPSQSALNEAMVSSTGHERAGLAGEGLRHEHVLRQEALDAACAADEDLVLLGELVDAEDGDDVLEVLVALQDLLDARRHGVVLLADVARIEDARHRVERIDGRVDAQLGDRAAQRRRRVEVGERRRRGRVGQVVCGDVDGLQRRDRVAARRRDALLELAHLVGQGRLVAHGRGHAAEERRDLGACLREAEDVVDEQEHVLLLHVAEVLRHGERREGDAKARARGLVHLPEHEGRLGDDARLGHLEEEVVALAGALADAGEHRDAAEVLGDAVDHLLDEDGLADTGAAEQADLAALDVRGQQVDDLDARPEDLGLRLELVEGGRLTVDAPPVGDLQRRLRHVERDAQRVPHVAHRDVADGNGDRVAGVAHLGAADQAVGRLHRDGAHHVVADVLRDLEGQGAVAATLLALAEVDVDVQRVEELGHGLDGELHVDDRAGDAGHAADAGLGLGRCGHFRSLS